MSSEEEQKREKIKLEIEELQTEKNELSQSIEEQKEELAVDCWTCTCGLVTECNCKHMGIRTFRNNKALSEIDIQNMMDTTGG